MSFRDCVEVNAKIKKPQNWINCIKYWKWNYCLVLTWFCSLLSRFWRNECRRRWISNINTNLWMFTFQIVIDLKKNDNQNLLENKKFKIHFWNSGCVFMWKSHRVLQKCSIGSKKKRKELILAHFSIFPFEEKDNND